MAVAVVIHPSGAGAEFVRPPKPGLLRHIRKRSIAIVVEQVILPQRRDENIVVAVIVEIADRNAHAVHFHGESGLPRYISKSSVVIVVIQREGGMPSRVSWPRSAIYKKNVQPAVVVVIQKRHAWAHRFGQPLFTEGTVVVDEVNPRGSRHIFKLRRSITSGTKRALL